MAKLPLIQIDDQAFAAEGATEIGAVRQVGPSGIRRAHEKEDPSSGRGLRRGT